MPQHPFTTHGISRVGDEYQDLWGIELLLEWLEHPERYDWVRFECDDMGALDDVVARRSGGGLICRQMKHTPEPDRVDLAASWDWLIAQKAGKNGPCRSLLQHWADGLDKRLDEKEVVEAGLFTNRRPDHDVNAARVGMRIDFDRIVDSARQQAIVDQLGGTDRARAFFQRFDFHLDLPSYDAFEQSLKERFRRSLGGDDTGWANLRASARDWALRKDHAGPGGRIFFADVRRAALWHQLLALPQDFAVPDDYIVPDPCMQDALVEELRAPGNGTIVIAAGPGFGKSTFLSHLTNLLSGQGVPVIRHHYYMAARARAGDRFLHRVVLESLMAQLLRHHVKLLGSDANTNPGVDHFNHWLTAAGKAAVAQGTALVIIIDGLDHVWREQGTNTELLHLFNRLLPPPDGVRLVIGTQPLDDNRLPPRLLREAPRGTWRSFPRLSEMAVRELLRRNGHRLRGIERETTNDYQLAEAATAFYRLSDGHPLVLRYSVEALIARSLPAFPEEIASLPTCPAAEIGLYYDSLCYGLDETARRQLHLFAVTGFPWPANELRQIIDPAGLRSDETRAALRSIRHLFQETCLGLFPFHASLTVYLRGVSEHLEYRNELLDQVAGWLGGRAPEAWQWAYRWLIAADRGDPGDLIARSDEAWLTEAIVARRPGNQVDRILARASCQALQSRDLPRTVELGVMALYAQQARVPILYDLTPLTVCALQSGRRHDLVNEMRTALSDLPEREMVALVEAQIGEAGGQNLAEACLMELRNRLANLTDHPDHSQDEWDEIMRPFPWLVGFCKRALTKQDLAYIRKSTAKGGPGFQAFLAARARIHCWTELPSVLTLVSDQMDFHDLAVGAFRHAQPAGIDWLRWDDRDSWCLGPMALATRMAREDMPDPPPSPLVPWPAPALDRFAIVVDAQRKVFLDLHRIFFANLTHAWLGAPLSDPDQWGAPDRSAMAAAGQVIGRQLASGRGIELAEVFHALPRGERQAGENAWDARWRERDVHRAGVEILLDLAVLRGIARGEQLISAQELIPLIDAAGRWCRHLRDALIDGRLDGRQPILSPDALAAVVEHERARLACEIGELPDRFEDYARLAWLVCLHQPTSSEISVLTTCAARCAIGYGRRKDLLLSEAMEAIGSAVDAMPDSVRRWIKQLVPFVDAVGEFTDGKENSHHKVGVGEMLLRIAPAFVPPYIRHLAENDRLRADQVTAHYVTSVDPATPEARELISLAGGDETRTVLWSATSDAAGGDELPETDDRLIRRFPAEPLPDVATYPPDRFDDFRRASGALLSDATEVHILAWFRHWKTTQRDATLAALAAVAERELYPHDMYAALLDAFHDVRPVAGSEAAFVWLVHAHRATMGWIYFWRPEVMARDVWAELRRHYPGRWHEFIQATVARDQEANGLPTTLGPARLVRFLLDMEQADIATAVVCRLINALLCRTADLPLGTPQWAERLDG
jgi:hypothetical protein